MRTMSELSCECHAQAQRGDRVRYVALGALACPEGRNHWKRQALVGVRRSFFMLASLLPALSRSAIGNA